jgi:hypothetical protein
MTEKKSGRHKLVTRRNFLTMKLKAYTSHGDTFEEAVRKVMSFSEDSQRNSLNARFMLIH